MRVFRWMLLGCMSCQLLASPAKPVLVVHGGTGEDKKDLTVLMEREYRAGLEEALKKGYALWKSGAKGLDVVEEAVRVLEDNPHFNAGRGAVFTYDGKNELDASIMDGKDLRAGAVAGVTRIRNPISLAKAVMEKSPHVFLVSAGAEKFAESVGIPFVDPSFFFTKKRWDYHLKMLKEKTVTFKMEPHKNWSTVGAVTRDKNGNLASATSTGGMTNKRWGRVGDSPVIGAGTYADNEGVAISATGHGEYFIRYGVAHDINALVKYKSMKIQAAADEVVQNKLKKAGGEGGVIGIDKSGNIAMSRNSEGLYRGVVFDDGKVVTYLYDN